MQSYAHFGEAESPSLDLGGPFQDISLIVITEPTAFESGDDA